MNIGILTMQRVINYGSFLQSYALKAYLENMGHNIEFIDIKNGRQIVENKNKRYDSNIFKYISNRIDKDIFKKIRRYGFVKERKERFNNEFFPMLGLGSFNYRTDYDGIVIGSDEVFNCTQSSPWGFSKTLIGGDLNSDLIISYAASCGSTRIENVYKLGIEDEVREAMSNFNAISCRDLNTEEFSKEFSNAKIYSHIDPTLIYSFENEIKENTINESNYILVYWYDDRINDKEIIKKTKDFARKNNLKIIAAGVYQKWADKKIVCNPFELLNYFKNASYVLTDTFHGTVFSIKENVPFLTIVRDSNKEKLTDLLNKFDLLDRLVTSKDDLEKEFNRQIDYISVNERIKAYELLANNYFKKHLIK